MTVYKKCNIFSTSNYDTKKGKTIINKAILIGRLGKDPEIKSLPSGDSVCNFSVATSEKYTDKSGQKQERTEWHNITIFGKLAEIAGRYLKKGSLVYLEGKIQTRKWQGSDGSDKYTTEINVREIKMLGGNPADAEKRGAYQDKSQTSDTSFDDFDSDIPF